MCETWLDNSILDHELFVEKYSLIRRDRNRHGGGIAIYVQDVTCSVDFVHPTIELLIVHLKLKHSNITWSILSS